MHCVLTTYTFFEPFVTKVTLLNFWISKENCISKIYGSSKPSSDRRKLNSHLNWLMAKCISHFPFWTKNLVNSLFYAVKKNCLLFQTNDLIHKKEKLLTRLTEAEVLQCNLDRRSRIVSAFLRYSWHNPDDIYNSKPGF